MAEFGYRDSPIGNLKFKYDRTQRRNENLLTGINQLSARATWQLEQTLTILPNFPNNIASRFTIKDYNRSPSRFLREFHSCP